MLRGNLGSFEIIRKTGNELLVERSGMTLRMIAKGLAIAWISAMSSFWPPGRRTPSRLRRHDCGR